MKIVNTGSGGKAGPLLYVQGHFYMCLYITHTLFWIIWQKAIIYFNIS